MTGTRPDRGNMPIIQAPDETDAPSRAYRLTPALARRVVLRKGLVEPPSAGRGGRRRAFASGAAGRITFRASAATWDQSRPLRPCGMNLPPRPYLRFSVAPPPGDTRSPPW